MKTQIYLSAKKTNALDLAPVYCRISHGDVRSEISLGIFVKSKEFCNCNMAESYNLRIIQFPLTQASVCAFNY